ncbi:NEDD8-activating enzyme E1 regulatory subunit isoform X2 [Coccinella septempunctata]|nr:NEDD8-activating enzyme E1 regulatory subunit isoform X2 [Coccinella septempunctata]
MSRAQVATQALLELNLDVRGDYIDEAVEHVLSHSENFFSNFDLVIAAALSEKVLIPLSKHLWEANVPLIVCRSIGFLGYIRLQVKEHTVIESHPDSENPDLRLINLWPELENHLQKIDISKLDSKERSHVPAIVILYYYISKFKEQNNGALPVSREDKNQIRKMIRESAVNDENGIKTLEENFEEAIRFVNTCISNQTIPSQIREILEDDSCTNLTQKSRPFWIMCTALREFVETEGALPVRGTLPDMASDSESYITLQQIYQRKAQAQAESIYRRSCQIARNVGMHQDSISEQEVKLFCKHSSELFVMRGSSIADEYTKHCPDLSSQLEDPDSLMFYYVILRGFERFIGDFNTYPGQYDDHVEPDVLKLKMIIGKLLNEWGCSQILRDERVHEICRYGGAELHSVSAVLGGTAAHEAIKLVTHQYKPLNNTFIYDAITSNSATYTL